MRILAILLVINLVFSCKDVNQGVSENYNPNTVLVEDSVPSLQQKFQYSPPKLPTQISFAGEQIDLRDIDMRERFDKELVVNNFWHSNTLFYFKRANRWFPLMMEILEEENVPTDFVYLAVIESGLDQVTSPSGAKGFWQFMPGTAKEYNLIVNSEIDERYNVEKSTKAAAKYLKQAYNKFGSWTLAAASYNRGMAGIERDLEHQYGSNFFDLYLNNETSRYVFRILAVKQIMENPEDFGFVIPEETLYPVLKVRKISIYTTVNDLPKWAIENGVNFKILKKLNPWLISNTLTVRPTDQIEVYLPDENEQLKPYKRS